MQLHLAGENIHFGIRAMRCLPVQAPEAYISLQANDREVGLIRDLADWPADQRALIREALDRRYYFQQLQRVQSIRKFGNFLEFTACTELGQSEFVLRYQQDSVQAYGRSGRLLTDIEDNHYLIPDLDALPDRALFNRFIYW